MGTNKTSNSTFMSHWYAEQGAYGVGIERPKGYPVGVSVSQKASKERYAAEGRAAHGHYYRKWNTTECRLPDATPQFDIEIRESAKAKPNGSSNSE